jgi:hypothetical protein
MAIGTARKKCCPDILRIIVVAFLAALFWHTVIAAGTP